MLLLSLLAFGCTDGPAPETLIDDVRVVAMVAEPPEVAPGETVRVELTVAAPGEVEVLAWSCTDLGEGCLEAGAEVVALEGAQGAVEAQVPAALAGVLEAVGEEPLRATALWALACEPGLCPLIERARNGEVDPAELADPGAWMAELPLEGVSLGLRSLAVSGRAERHANPLLAPAFEDAPRAAPGEVVDLAFEIEVAGAPEAELSLYGYAGAGGFAVAGGEAVEAGPATLNWYAPVDGMPGEVVPLWVVLTDSLGGAAVWTGEAVIE